VRGNAENEDSSAFLCGRDTRLLSCGVGPLSKADMGKPRVFQAQRAQVPYNTSMRARPSPFSLPP